MADIFNSTPGIVVAVEAEQAIPSRIRIGGFEPKAALISGMDYRQRTNQQFQYSLDRNVYVYVFGDLMGDLVISGIAFPQLCTGEDGIVEVLNFYKANRAAKQPDAIAIAVGNEVITGMMTGLRLAAQASGYDKFAPAERYDITINTVPRD